MTDAVVTLKKGEGRYLQKGGPWIYDNEIADISPGAEDGGLVRVCGENGLAAGPGLSEPALQAHRSDAHPGPGTRRSTRISSSCG